MLLKYPVKQIQKHQDTDLLSNMDLLSNYVKLHPKFSCSFWPWLIHPLANSARWLPLGCFHLGAQDCS